MATNEDLWPDNLVSEIPKTPTHILREQAAALGKKTSNVVQAKVRTRTDDEGDFVITFALFTPSLQGYEYDLFTIWHKEDLYPVHHAEKLLEDEAAFVAHLKFLFSARHTVRIVRALVAQARAQDDDDDIPF